MKRKSTIGILLVNLGTPDSPSIPDVKKYLIEFLTDDRVIDYPWLKRQLLVRGIIVPARVKNSAATYRKIWDEKGSPLKYISEELRDLLQKNLMEEENTQTQYEVVLAMRYQQPNIESALRSLQQKLVDHIIILPLFPQYASATTGSIHQKVMEIVSNWQSIPNLSFVNSYHDNPDFIEALASIGKTYQPENYDHILFSFHGLPERQLLKADTGNYCLQDKSCCENINDKNRFCYKAQCTGTAKAIAKALNIPKEEYTICFQSRLGKEVWIQPYLNETLERLAKEGKKKILAFSPAFVADCLETIYEIGVECQEDFEHWGGEKVQLVESLNTHPLWVKTLVKIIQKYTITD